MRRKTFHVPLPPRRGRVSEGFVDGAKFASMDLSSTAWSGRGHQGMFKDFLPKGQSHLNEQPPPKATARKDQASQTSEEFSSPAKRPKLETITPGTPVATLRLQRSLLSKAIEEDKSAWEDEKSFLEKELAELKEENQQMKQQLSSVQALQLAEAELKDKLKQSEETEENLLASVETLKREHSKIIMEMKSSKEYEVDMLSAQVSKKDSLIKTLREQIEEVKNELANKAEESVLCPRCQPSSLDETLGLGAITSELLALRETIEEQDKMKLIQDERITVLQNEILELKEDKEQSVKIRHDLEEKIALLAEEKETFVKQIADLKTETEQITELRSKIHMFELTETELKEKLQQSVLESKALEETMRKNIEDLNLEHSKLLDELKSSNEIELDSFSNQIMNKDALIEELGQKVEEMKSELARRIEEIQQLSTKETASAESKHRDLMALKETIEELEKVKLVQNERIASLQSEILELNENNEHSVKIRQELEEKIALLAEEKKACAQQIADFKTETEQITELQSKVHVLELAETELKEKLQQSALESKALEETLRKNIEDLNLEHSRLLEELKSSNERELEAFSNQIMNKDALIEEFKEQMKQMKVSEENLRKNIEDLNLEHSKHNEDLISSKQIEIDTLCAQISDKESLIEELKEQVKKMKESEENLRKNIEDLKLEHSQHSKQNEELSASKQIEIDTLFAKVVEKESLIEELKERVEESKLLEKTLRKNIEDLNLEHSKLLEELKSSNEMELDAFSNQIMNKDALIEELQEKVEEMKSELARQIEENQQLSTSTKETSSESKNSDLMALKETIEELEKMKVVQNERIASLQSKILELKEDNVKCVKIQQDLEEQMALIVEQKEECVKQVAECKSNCSLEIAELKGSIVTEMLKLNEEIADKEKELRDQINKTREYQILLEKKETEYLESVTKMNEELAGKEKELNEYANKTREYQILLENKEADYLVSVTKLNETLAGKEKELSEQINKTREYQMLLEKKETDTEYLENVRKLNEELAAKEKELNELANKTQEYQMMLEKKEADYLLSLTKMNEMLAGKEKELNEHANKTREYQMMLEKKEAEYIENVTKMNEELVGKEKKLSDQVNKTREYQMLLEKKETEYLENVKTMNAEIEKLKSGIQQGQSGQAAQASVNAKYTEKLKQDIKKSWEDIKKLETEISQLKTCIQEKDKLINSKAAEIKAMEVKNTIQPEDVEALKRELAESKLKAEKVDKAETELQAVSIELKKKLGEIKDLSESLEKAQNSSKRVSRCNRGSQTPDEWSPEVMEEYIGKLKLEDKKTRFECSRRVKDLTQKFEIQKKQMLSASQAKTEEIEKLNRIIEEKEKQVQQFTSQAPTKVDSEIQCDLMTSLLVRAMKGEKGLLPLPEKFPDVGRLISDNRHQERRLLQLEAYHKRCTCPDKDAKFTPFKLIHKSQTESQTSDSGNGDSQPEKRGVGLKGPYSLRTRDKSGKVMSTGVMSVKPSSFKTKALSAFPSSLSSYTPGTGISTLSKLGVISSKEDFTLRKRPCPPQSEEVIAKKPTSPLSNPATDSKCNQPDPINNGAKVLAEVDNVPSVSVAEKIQQFNKRQKEISVINEKSTPCKKTRVDLNLKTPEKAKAPPNDSCDSPALTYEEFMSLGPKTPVPQNKVPSSSIPAASSSKENKKTDNKYGFRRLQDMSDTELDPDELFEELMNLP